MNELIDILNKQRRLYQKLANSVENRRQNWDSFHDKNRKFFNSVLKEFKKESFFDSLHINEGNNRFSERKNQNSITLYFGQHPTGIQEIEYNKNGEFKSGSLIVEKGGALHYAQSSNGQVVCIIYGCKSELLKNKDEWFVFKRYDNPSEITEKEMLKSLKVFFWYNRITSYMKGFTILDTYRLDFYKLKSLTSMPDWNMVFGIIGAIAGIISILAFLF